MKLSGFLLAFSFLMLFACKEATPVETTKDGAYYGEQFEITGTTSVSDAINKMSDQDTMNIQLAGVVKSVCKKKGCWTNIASTETSDEAVFVKFKDYGFFLPLDCEGQEVVMQGKAYIEETPVDELRHYAEDEGKSKEEIAAITEPEKEYKFMASGVYLKNKS